MQSTGVGAKRFALAGVVVALATILSHGVPARAADYTTLSRQVTQAIAATQSGKMVMDISSEGTSQHWEAIAVGKGVQKAYHLKQTARDKTGSHTIEWVVTDKQTCLKLLATWRCTPVTEADGLRSALNNPLQYAKQEAGVTISVTPIGSRTIQGQRCIGYQIADKARNTGQFWLNAGSKLPVQLDMKTTSKPAITIQMVWSHWNDPALHLPAVNP